jgi:hypothetical protein
VAASRWLLFVYQRCGGMYGARHSWACQYSAHDAAVIHRSGSWGCVQLCVRCLCWCVVLVCCALRVSVSLLCCISAVVGYYITRSCVVFCVLFLLGFMAAATSHLQPTRCTYQRHHTHQAFFWGLSSPVLSRAVACCGSAAVTGGEPNACSSTSRAEDALQLQARCLRQSLLLVQLPGSCHLV